MRDRAFRRARMDRKKQQAKAYFWGLEGVWPEDIRKVLGRRAHTHKPCSGMCCGNPRKHFHEPTMQERRLEPVESAVYDALLR